MVGTIMSERAAPRQYAGQMTTSRTTRSSGLHVKTCLWIFVMVIFGPLGNILLRKGMKVTTAPAVWTPAEIAGAAVRAFGSGTRLARDRVPHHLPDRQHAGPVVGRLQLRPAHVGRGVRRRRAAGLLCAGRGRLAHPLDWRGCDLPRRVDDRPDIASNHGDRLVTEGALLLVIVAAGTGGELCVARAMRRVGEVADFWPMAILRALGDALRIGWLWVGIGLMAVAFLALLAVLSVEDVSFVVPVTALSYVAGALGGAFFLGERVGPERWIGVLLVCLGVALVFVGRG